ncbi:type IV secretion system protein [uncultured Azohydromonas sp.]|mgnify:CR=1 FL=1|jgi:Type IV secretory pathway, VirB6 components|uniref:type IV secretion system protein n=1 Tax=uncultured Azohydromonas sp. TaxID=487342 RepID=UPI002625FF83|nr:type IV secretion system protein [uncultured Azohydromonas sp.]
MDPIISVLGTQIDNTLFAFVGQVVRQLIAYLGPIALGLVTIWVLHFAIMTMLGKSSDPIMEFAWKASTLYLIVGTATVGGFYHEWVIDTHNALATNVVTMFAPPGSQLKNINSVWNALDVFNTAASNLAGQMLLNSAFRTIDPVLGLVVAVAFAFGNVIFLFFALCVVFFVKAISSFLLGVGPIFILTLMFQATRQYFFNWLGALLGSVVLTWVVFFILGFTLNMNTVLVGALSANLGVLNVFAKLAVFLAFCLAFGLFLWQGPSFAAGLTGGSPMQMGAGAVMQMYHLLKKGKQPAPNPNGAGGGSVAPNRAYNAGQAMGSAVASSAQWAYQRIAAAGGRRP